MDDVSRSDATKDCKFGALSGSQRGLIELAALVFYKVVILLKMQAWCFIVWNDLHAALSAVGFFICYENLVIVSSITKQWMLHVTQTDICKLDGRQFLILENPMDSF